MNKKYVKTALFSCIISLIFSCNKRAEPIVSAPDPEPILDYRVTRQFQYYSGKVAHIEYKTPSIGYKATFHKDSSLFTLDLSADTIRDEFHFEFKTENVSRNNLVTYPIRQRIEYMNEGYVTYIYHNQLFGSKPYAGNIYPWEGYINILSYDAKRKLISGDCRVVLNDVVDPVTGIQNEKCKIALLVLFNKLKYEEVP